MHWCQPNPRYGKLSHKNMYFIGVKSTTHPPIMGTLGQGTDFIEKRPNTAVINIYLHSCQHFVSCWMSNSGLKQKLHLQTIKHTGIGKLKVCPECLLLLLLSGSVCADELMCLSKMSKRIASSIGTV